MQKGQFNDAGEEMRTSVMQKGSYNAERIVQRCWRGYEDECNAKWELRCRKDSSTMLERK